MISDFSDETEKLEGSCYIEVRPNLMGTTWNPETKEVGLLAQIDKENNVTQSIIVWLPLDYVTILKDRLEGYLNEKVQ